LRLFISIGWNGFSYGFLVDLKVLQRNNVLFKDIIDTFFQGLILTISKKGGIRLGLGYSSISEGNTK
jgi:hypothetical protein